MNRYYNPKYDSMFTGNWDQSQGIPSHTLNLPEFGNNYRHVNISANTQWSKASSKIDRELAIFYHPKHYSEVKKKPISF